MRGRRWPRPWLWVAAWFACGAPAWVGCGGSPGGPQGGTAALAWALAQDPTIEWQVLSTALEDHPRLQAARERLASLAPFDWTESSQGSSGQARLVVGLADNPAMQRWLERVGVNIRDDAWVLQGVSVRAQDAGLIATLRDPERPRWPLTFACATEPDVLALLLDRVEPGTLPAAQLMRGEFPVMRVGLDDQGYPIAERARDCQPWFWQPGLRDASQEYAAASYPVMAMDGCDRATVERFAQALRATWDRVKEWAGPVGPRYVRLFPQSHAHHWLHSGEGQAWSRVDRHSDLAQVLLPPGFLADGGAGIVGPYLRSALGDPALAWMEDACALQASGWYNGTPLAQWWPVLARIPDLGLPRDWIQSPAWARRSPHLVRPLRALLLQLAWEDDPANLRILWAADAEHEAWRGPLERVGERLGELAAQADLTPWAPWPETAPVLGVAFQGGLDPDGAGPWSASHQALLTELQALGAGAIALPMALIAEPHGPLVRRPSWGQVDHRYAVRGESLLAAAVLDAQSKGMATALELEVWAKPSGVPLKDLVWPDAERIQEFFAAYRASSLHAALFARLYGVSALSLGNRLGETLRTEAKEGEASLARRAPVFAARRQGWQSVWPPVRSVYPGLTVAGPGPAAWVDQSPPLQDLDGVAVQASVDIGQLASPSATKVELGAGRWAGWFDLWARNTRSPCMLWPLGPAPPEPSRRGAPEIGIVPYAQREASVWEALGVALAADQGAALASTRAVFLGPLPFDGNAAKAAGQAVMDLEQVARVFRRAVLDSKSE